MTGSIAMSPGSTYTYECSADRDWRTSMGVHWDLEVYSPDGTEDYAGRKWIDGSECAVFWCRRDVRYRAVLAHMVVTR